VLRGKPVRRDPENITVFESVGIAYEYLVARAAIGRANS